MTRTPYLCLVLGLSAYVMPMAMSFAGLPPGFIAFVNVAIALAAVVTGHRTRTPRPAVTIVGMGLGYFWLVSNIGFVLLVAVLGNDIRLLLARAADWLASDVKSP